MAPSFSFGQINLGTQSAGASPTPAGAPFRILVMGNFGGRVRADRRTHFVDRDNFDDVFAKLGVELRLPLLDDTTLTLRFAELDDFHPDRLVGRVELFESLRATRNGLLNPATSAQTATEVRSWVKRDAPTAEPAPAGPLATSPAELLDQLIGEAPTEPPPAAGGSVDWNSFLAKVVEPHLAPSTEPDQEELLSIVDQVTSAQMRSLLHYPSFQALEAAWRGLFFLVRRLDTDSGLKIHILDISQEELAADLDREELAGSLACKLLVDDTTGTPGAPPWAAIAGLYAFHHTRGDVELLGRMAKLAQLANAPFLAEARPAVLGCTSLAKADDPRDWNPPRDLDGWRALRELPESAWLGLALPRVLLRLPYSEETSPCEQFDFQEMDDQTGHEAYLWGNPAIFCAYSLGASFNRAGWDLHPGMVQEIDGLPLVAGAEDALPCAEVVLIDRAAAAILNQGLIPIRSVKDRDMVLVGQFQSVAEPARPLAGRWE